MTTRPYYCDNVANGEQKWYFIATRTVRDIIIIFFLRWKSTNTWKTLGCI